MQLKNQKNGFKIFLLPLLLLLLVAISSLSLKRDSSVRVTLGKNQLKVELADTNFKREKGLSGRKDLNQNSGMLFVFPASARHVFWMKDMLFSLDFIWLNKSRVVELSQNVAPPENPGEEPITLTPKDEVDMVLEVPAGYISQKGITIGDLLTFNH